MQLSHWRPTPAVVLPRTLIAGPAVPVIDVHNHLGRWLSADDDWLVSDVSALVATMDAAGVRHLVNLDGRWGDELAENIARYDATHPVRFSTFCQLDWQELARDDDPKTIVDRLCRSLEASARAGAKGVKVWKDLGLSVRDHAGSLVAPDDPRVLTVLSVAGDLGLPVLIHTADPASFFDPLDERNERWEELQRHPDWWFGGAEYPTFAALMGSLDRLLDACPATTFIGAHVGCWAEDLGAVGHMLRDHDHWHADLGGRLAEIGRQPRRFAELVSRFPDRVLFGTDAFPPAVDDYLRYYRFLETADEHFDYSGEPTPPQGRWAISGCELPMQLLERVYWGNAARILRLE